MGLQNYVCLSYCIGRLQLYKLCDYLSFFHAHFSSSHVLMYYCVHVAHISSLCLCLIDVNEVKCSMCVPLLDTIQDNLSSKFSHEALTMAFPSLLLALMAHLC